MNPRSASLLKVAKILAYCLVVIGIAYTVWQGVGKLSESRISWSSVQWNWLPVASGFYVGSMLICWLYWHNVLRALGQHPRLRDSFRAFVLGQLGKYFPGKALVVFLRTSQIAGPRVQPAVAATSVFLETLTFMAVGAGVSSLIMILFIDVGPWLIVLGIGAIVMAGLPVIPSVFRFLIRTLRIDRLSPKIGQAVAKLNSRTALLGWLMLPFSWLLIGLSLWSTIRMFGVAEVPLEQVPRLTASAGLAVVAGFLSLLPGGLGVRELVLIAILMPVDPAFDTSSTLAVAVALRLVWLMTEALLTIILKVTGWCTKTVGAPQGPESEEPARPELPQEN